MADAPSLPPVNVDQAFDEAFSPQSQQNANLPGNDAPQAIAPESIGPVNVVNPEGKLVSIPAEQLQDALNSGYQQATQDHIDQFLKEQKYGTAGQQAITVAEGLGQGIAGPLAPAAERALGVPTEDIPGREEVNPGEHALAEAGGLGVGAFTGVGEGALLEHAGAAVGDAVMQGITKGAARSALQYNLAKIGSSAVKGAVENALFQSGDEVAKVITQDPSTSVETAMTNIGLAGLLGTAAGGAFGSVSPLWKAANGSKLGQTLKAITNKAGGIEGVVSDEIDNAIEKTGMNVSPEIRAAMSKDPELQQMAKTLEQSDTTKSGLQYQESLNNFRKQAGETLIRAFGKDPEAVVPEISKYEHGKNIGETLAKEYQEKLEPIAKEFEALKGKYQDKELIPDQVIKGETDYSNPYEAKQLPDQTTPGTVSKIADSLSQLAAKQGWVGADNSIEAEFNRVMKQLPQQKTLSDLSRLMTQIGDNTAGLDLPLSRAGQLMKRTIGEFEDEVALAHLGNEAPELIDRYGAARKAYRQQALLQDELNERLHIKGSNTSNFAKGLKEMAQTDGETLLNRISGKSDSHLLGFLEGNFPKTAEALKKYHIESLLQQAASKAKGEDLINAGALRKGLESMSPELRQFAIPGEALAKVDAVGTMLDQLNKVPHNFSNTARTADKLLSYLPGSAIGMATMLASHNPAVAVLVGGLTKIIGKDAPDAVRLALLKFLGSSEPVEAEGFKTMVDMIHHTIQGESLVRKATKNLFKAGGEVISESQLPSEAERARLDKSLKQIQTNPETLQDVGGKAAHYLPEHGPAIGQVAANAANYLNSLRPNTDTRQPLDTKIEPSTFQKAAFNRALDVAQQPLLVLHQVKQGRVTPQDIITMKTIYPNLYTKLSQKLNEQIIETVNRGETVPYNTRLGLAMFLGQPLDSTMTPQAILAAQPKPPMAQPQTATQPASNPKRSTNALNKLSGMYQTASQHADSRRIAKD